MSLTIALAVFTLVALAFVFWLNYAAKHS
ncbi:hypothetical protein APP6_1086 [Actinobacillus pleuropneumoniae serovar 6 str. Femo]|nr:hypothetical protein APP2_0991 [Actinobacillus pleuropneumoniae serovar 2 str. 4226]EFL77563.1 hypothetical protein APP2_1003 [Actinobacillus pleuropneumoniae serovar 2 str. 4226]EFL77565.1 hypothetical protein APP2_0946 [Actinobacillus pleuropneumoniae serovar 2 str. 4226]EFL79648.1 hypothetical protein APP2_0360 [Actinobacillus pleuropneumoniae serovar 2 str. 4226]EFL81641.1 hypothetical protein APP6_1086 [Actinobacillus pleuropneumoniae serovar 6 str. Femo]